MKSIVNFIRHISDMAAADGKKRIVYAFLNLIAMAIAAGFAWLFVYCLGVIESTSVVLGIFGLILSGALTVFTFLYGLVGQIALIFIAGAGMFGREDRGSNFVAFIIALVTTVALVIAGYFLIKSL